MKNIDTALTNIRRTPYQAIVATAMIAITFFVAYSFSLTVMGAQAIMRFFETRPQVIAFFHLSVTDKEINVLVEEMDSKPYTDTVKIVSKEQALKIYQADYQDNPALLELVTADILPASIEVSAIELEALHQAEKDLAASSYIEEVVLQQDIIDALNSWTSFLRVAGMISTTILGVTSFLLVTIILGLKIANKKSTISIMRIIGASKSFIFIPFLLEVVIYAVAGSVIGWGMMYVGFLYATPWIKDFLGSVISWPVDWRIFAYQLAIGTSIGVFLVSLASLFSVRRLIKR